MKKTFVQKLFSFRFVQICGMVMGFYVFGLQSETQPLSSFIFRPSLYLVASLIALSVDVLVWLLIDKGTFYEFSHVIKNLVDDCIIINIVLLCTLSFLFLFTIFA